MAISTYDEFISRLGGADVLSHYKTGTTASNRLASQWASALLSGSIPTTATACNSTTVGALNLNQNIGNNTNDYRFVAGDISTGTSSSMTFISDRLSHQGGLSGTTTGAQTTNLPTAALTRYTSGVGVFAALEIYTAVGATATVARCSYTNQAGTAGRTSKDVVFGGSGNSSAGRVFILPLQDGDTGVRSVESVTLDASTLTAGSFGVVLFKPIFMMPPYLVGVEAYGANFFNSILRGCCQMQEVLQNSCLHHMQACVGSASGAFNLKYISVS